MIRRRLGRVRRALAARLVPLLRAPLELVPLLRTVTIVMGTIIATALESLRRRLRPGAPFRIAIDVRPYYEPLTGIGWYQHHLMEEWSKDPGVELLGIGDAMETGRPRFVGPLPDAVRVLAFDLSGIAPSRWSAALCSAAYPALIYAARADVHFAPNYTFSRAHAAVASPRVIAVHDLTFRRHPELLQKETLAHLEATLPAELQRADAIVCVSEATRRDLISLFGVSERRAVAVLSGLGNPPSEEGASLPEGVHPPYALFVSTIEPRKNVGAILDAVEILWNDERWTGHLVLAGRTGWKSESLIDRMATSPWAARIRRLEYVDRATLSALYARAEMFVFPSWYEGFGFPLLEAMAHGVPCITSAVSSLPEVGGDAALYVDPAEPQELAAAIERLALDEPLRRRMAEAGRARAAMFRWDRAAAQTLSVLRRVAGVTG